MALAIAVLLLAGCGAEQAGSQSAVPTQAVLRIKEQPWTGWQREQPPSTTREVKVERGGTVVLDRDRSRPISLRLVDLGDGAPRLRSSAGVSIKRGSGIDLRNCDPHEVTLRQGRSVTFSTCTMDGGTHWTITEVSRA